MAAEGLEMSRNYSGVMSYPAEDVVRVKVGITWGQLTRALWNKNSVLADRAAYDPITVGGNIRVSGEVNPAIPARHGTPEGDAWKRDSSMSNTQNIRCVKCQPFAEKAQLPVVSFHIRRFDSKVLFGSLLLSSIVFLERAAYSKAGKSAF